MDEWLANGFFRAMLCNAMNEDVVQRAYFEGSQGFSAEKVWRSPERLAQCIIKPLYLQPNLYLEGSIPYTLPEHNLMRLYMVAKIHREGTRFHIFVASRQA